MNSMVRRQQGFTLLEVMIALMVFALISMMAWQIIHGAMENAAFTDKQTANLSQLQLTYSRLERDFTQMVPRPVQGDDRAFHLNGEALAFTTQDNLAAFGRPAEPDILRVTWLVDKNTLWREFSPALDLAANTQGTRVPVLEHVKGVQWRFFQEGWRPTWDSKANIPQGVELTLTMENDEQWRWVFVASEGWPQELAATSGEETTASPDQQNADNGTAAPADNKAQAESGAAENKTASPQGGTQ
ncbi:type II secretion system minor pseudopilin GspJ [Atlantibacter sp.]|uniref:type II secretion system minor pseudopilin GspJ n=1 Tax=Atlantibacter sp. TaxID=1903473 RepID=UPI0028AEE8C8|nr:type II secretion system minor pseudopilin GspJ [Atlantibacter sp.]